MPKDTNQTNINYHSNEENMFTGAIACYTVL